MARPGGPGVEAGRSVPAPGGRRLTFRGYGAAARRETRRPAQAPRVRRDGATALAPIAPAPIALAPIAPAPITPAAILLVPIVSVQMVLTPRGLVRLRRRVRVPVA